jgi:hypothetical protein
LDEALTIAEREGTMESESNFRGRTYGALAKLLEAEGDLKGALDHYRIASEIPSFRRWGWRDDCFPEKARAIAERLSG